jgi:hypothetical protein
MYYVWSQIVLFVVHAKWILRWYGPYYEDIDEEWPPDIN